MDIDGAINQALAAAQILKSTSADFRENEWVFTAPHIQVGAGEYVLLRKNDWDAFLSNLRYCAAEHR